MTGLRLLAATLGLACFTEIHAATFWATPSPSAEIHSCLRADPCSLEEARAKARGATTNMTDNVHVNLTAGTYSLSRTFALTEADSGRNGFSVIYQNEPGARVTITGGEALRPSWVNMGNGIWTLDGVSGAFRQLYVNGTRAVRARYPNLKNPNTGGDYLPASDSNPLRISASDIGALPVLGAEIVWQAHWNQRRATVASMAAGPASGQYTLGLPPLPVAAANALWSNRQATPYYYLENKLEYLDVPGEWFHDRLASKLYYKPRPGETLNGTTAVVVPRIETLLSISGTDAANPAHHIQVRGLTFEHSHWDGPSTSYGYINPQAGIHVLADTWTPVPAALVIKHANHVRLERNTVQHSGAHGLLIAGVHDHNSVVDNVFQDLAGGGIYDVPDGTSTSNSSYLEIAANLVRRTGRDYTDTVGILSTQPNHAVIELNEVATVPYTGISVGWSWNNADTGMSNNQIRRNYIHDAVQALDDGAGIYSLGYQVGSRYADNYIKSIELSPYGDRYPVVGIYLDEGSRYKTVEGNVLEETTCAFKIHQNDDKPSSFSTDNLFIGNFYRNKRSCKFSASEDRNTDEKNALYTTPDQSVSNIVGGAGRPVNLTALSGISARSLGGLYYAPQYAADKAVNGSTDEPGWSPNSSAQLWWWQVDLSAPKRLAKVEVVSRLGASNLDSPPSRRNFKVLASNDPNFVNGVVELASVDQNGYPFRETWSSVIDPKKPGSENHYQYLRLVKTAAEYFYLNEVRVWGF